MSALYTQEAPSIVCLSSASDAFAPQAALHTHALLAHWLPRGTVLSIVTKGVIPTQTLDLLAEFRGQIEGISVGVSNLDDSRNRIVEPGCPSARERLANIDQLAARRLPVALRLNPIFPTVDDAPEHLGALVREATRRGAGRVMGAYVFAWGRYLRRLKREPFLARACEMLTERAPMEGGGTAFSVPLSLKLHTYRLLAELSRQGGIEFNACRCQDLRLSGNALFATSCRNTTFLGQIELNLPTESQV